MWNINLKESIGSLVDGSRSEAGAGTTYIKDDHFKISLSAKNFEYISPDIIRNGHRVTFGITDSMVRLYALSPLLLRYIFAVNNNISTIFYYFVFVQVSADVIYAWVIGIHLTNWPLDYLFELEDVIRLIPVGMMEVKSLEFFQYLFNDFIHWEWLMPVTYTSPSIMSWKDREEIH